MKRCSGCGQEKPQSEYAVNRTQADGLQTYCKACQQSHQKMWRKSQVFERIEDDEIKVCSMCKEEKSASEFATHKQRRDGLQPHCKVCQRAYQAEYTERRFGETRARARAIKAEQKAEQARLLAARIEGIANAATITTIASGITGSAETAEVPEGFKRCSKCREVRPVAEFSKNKARLDGLQVQCTHCHAEYRQKLLERRIAEHAAREQEVASRMKQCTTCKETKPISEYYPNIRAVDGVQARCKRCSLDANRSHTQAANARRAAIVAERRAAMLQAQEKRCRRCQQMKPFSEFWRNKKGIAGLDSRCKACQKEMRSGEKG
jgi:hypothetical protein